MQRRLARSILQMSINLPTTKGRKNGNQGQPGVNQGQGQVLIKLFD